MDQKNAVRTLLEKMKNIMSGNFQYDVQAIPYNILNVLGIEYKEVLICRLLGDFLDPNGAHGMGSGPLKNFLDNVLKKNVREEEISNAAVLLEESAGKDRRADIVIHLHSSVIPIEVKIWAGDQKSQLQDYYKFFFHGDTAKKIYYLTPFGREPSKGSKGELNSEQIGLLSFDKDIDGWLKSIHDEGHDEGNMGVRYIIDCLRGVIKEMCADSRELNAILEALTPSNGGKYWESELFDSAITFMKHSEKIWEGIRNQYLMEVLDVGEDYDLKPLEENKPITKPDSHALFKIVKKDAEKKDTENIAAWVCVDTNLYLAAPKKEGERCANNWTPYADSYQWRYISPNSDQKKFALNKPINLQKYLKTIDVKKIMDEELHI